MADKPILARSILREIDGLYDYASNVLEAKPQSPADEGQRLNIELKQSGASASPAMFQLFLTRKGTKQLLEAVQASLDAFGPEPGRKLRTRGEIRLISERFIAKETAKLLPTAAGVH